jgi:hypothetical protein
MSAIAQPIPQVKPSTAKWTRWHTFGLLGVLVSIPLFGFLIQVERILLMWLLIMGALVLFAIIAGQGITGQFWLGWLIDEQYTMSLSRLQMFLWTVVVLSAFMTAVFVNIRTGHSDKALDIAIPEQVWLAMGISTISLVSSPLILSGKKKEAPNPQSMEKSIIQSNLVPPDASQAVKDQVMEQHSVGKVYRNLHPSDARLYDLVRGEETSNFDVLDLSRLQNLFFTVILVGAYAASLGGYFASQVSHPLLPANFPLSEFPGFTQSQVAILAISHAGYLAGKSINKQ